jgi:hypothetical protein
MTAGSLDSYRKKLATTEPRLASFFSSSIFQNDTSMQYTDFFAADPTSTATTPPYVRAEHFSQRGNPVDNAADVQQVLEQEGDAEIQVGPMMVRGGEGLFATGVSSVKGVRYRDFNLFLECHPAVQCVLVVLAPDTPQNRSDARTIVGSLDPARS